jgi:hypothetical protein
LSPAGSLNCFSSWTSPDIAIQDGIIYRAKWQVASNTTEPDHTIQFRLRLNQKGSWQGWNRTVTSNLQNAPFLGYPKNYSQLFDPIVTGTSDDDAVLAFDILSFDVQDDTSSWLYLEEVVVDTITITLGDLKYIRNFFSAVWGWQFAGQIPAYDVPLSSPRSIEMCPNGSTNCFSYWYSPDIAIDDNKVYLAAFAINSSVTDPDDAVQFRLRVNQKGSWQGWERVVSSNMGQAPSQSVTKSYFAFFDPGVTSATSAIDNQAVLSFDITSFDPADDTNSWLYLESVEIHEITLNP